MVFFSELKTFITSQRNIISSVQRSDYLYNHLLGEKVKISILESGCTHDGKIPYLKSINVIPDNVLRFYPILLKLTRNVDLHMLFKITQVIFTRKIPVC
jgi:hypothetical protein